MAQFDTITEPLRATPPVVDVALQSSSPGQLDQPVPFRRDRTAWVLAGGTTILLVLWLALIVVVKQARFVTLAPMTHVGVEATAALASLFGALVLSLFPADVSGQRVRWIAMGFITLGLGGIAFGFVPAVLGTALELNHAMYASIIVRTLAGTLFVIGLVFGTPPRLTPRITTLIVITLVVLWNIVLTFGSALPRLATNTAIQRASATDHMIFPGLTAGYFILGTIPLVLAVIAALGAAYHSDGGVLPRGFVVAMMLLAGSQAHNLMWPSDYNPILTMADLLRVAFAVVLLAGGSTALRRVAAERAALLAAEQEHSRRLVELAVLKADFTAMVAHELANPLAAIAGFAEILSITELSTEDRTFAVDTIRRETTTLITLVDDIRIAAAVERDDFVVRLTPVPASVLLADAAAFAKTLTGDHPVMIQIDTPSLVLADPERIGQVLRNLLKNAAMFSAPGTPIELRASKEAGHVRIAVADHGKGIAPEDMMRIFEKFGRGRDQTGQKVPGAGLGLYLSRRIIRAHGTDLTVHSTVGAGSVFSFELEASG